ncbi:pathogenesis-related leaf protein 6-like [Impatiens glandulifera]|uniref:pathogenesis-related leaf protein 6-like n=1 Tax=Impatiens glandulifera TaxID=253017 RepID=UPI001FB07C04|nr:pathogenesis-related leaf protein 6-like [Impatiens glandulifera]
MACFSMINSLAFFITITIISLICPSSRAQNSPQDYLNVHNTARSQVGVGPMVWNDTVAAYAMNYAQQRMGDCNLVHSGGGYGENLAKGSSGTFTGVAAVNLWVAEKPYYSYSSNACTGGQQCLHYTQVVWRNSIQLGCARVQCTNNGWWFVICNYNPPGNYVGQYPY